MKKPLSGKIAVVAGATVYCTGRSVRGNPSPYNRTETIEETAELITAAGGTGIWARLDHTVEADVKIFFERIAHEHGQLEVLVNAMAGEDPLLAGWSSFWETDLQNAVAALQQALLSHVITAKYAAPLMIKKRRGLIVEIVEGDLLFSSGNVLAQVVKFALKGWTATMAEELRPHRVAALAITPGYLRSETMLQRFGVTAENWREGGKQDKNFLESESPLFIGRAVAALAQDAKVFARTGNLTSTWEVAREIWFHRCRWFPARLGEACEAKCHSLTQMDEGRHTASCRLAGAACAARQTVSGNIMK